MKSLLARGSCIRLCVSVWCVVCGVCGGAAFRFKCGSVEYYQQGWQRTVFGVRKTDVHVRCFVRRSVLNVFGILFGSCSCSAFGGCCVRVRVRIACSCSVRCSGLIHMLTLNADVERQCRMPMLNVNVECQC